MQSKNKRITTMPNFKNHVETVNTLLAEYNITLSIKGYHDTVSRYFRLNDVDLDEVYDLAMECNLWSNYLGEMLGIVQLFSLQSIQELDIQKNNPSLPIPELMKLEYKVKTLKLFNKQIEHHQKFFTKAFRHCYRIYKRSLNVLRYRSA